MVFCGRWALWWSEATKKEEDNLVVAHSDEGLVVVGLSHSVEEMWWMRVEFTVVGVKNSGWVSLFRCF